MTDFEKIMAKPERYNIIDYAEPDYYPERFCINDGYIIEHLENLNIDIKWIFDPHGRAKGREFLDWYVGME